MIFLLGTFRVSVMADTFPSITELASIELPFFSILSTIVLMSAESSYEKWFPLLLSNQCIPIEGETGMMSHNLQKESDFSKYIPLSFPFFVIYALQIGLTFAVACLD